MTKQLTSSRHQDWKIEKDEDHFWMQHTEFDGYIIEVYQNKFENNEWYGEILTEQIIPDTDGATDWLEAQTNPMWAPVEMVKAEVIRRGIYWASK